MASARLRVAFLGNDPWSVPSLEALASSPHEVALVVTRVPRPAGRGSKLRPTAVAEAARRMALPLAEVETVKRGEGLERLREARPDVLVVVAYREILPPEVLSLPRLGAVNVHFSLLPELRGAAPVQRAILEGLPATGVTTMLMDEGLDTGPVLLQAREPVDPNDDAGSLGARLAAMGGRLMVDTLDRLEASRMEPRPQDDAAATFAPKLRPEERLIDWNEPAERVLRRIRAFAPEPGAESRFREGAFKILRAEPADASGAPGEIVASSDDGFAVAAGEGAIRPVEVQPAGKRRMTAAEFARGYRPRDGENLRAGGSGG